MRTEAPTSSGNNGVKLNYFESGVALLSLGAPEEKVVTLTMERMESLKENLVFLKGQNPKGLVITGPGLEMFTVGADINLIRDVKDPAIGEKFAKHGQEIFNMIEEMPCITVAAISGPCVGGGCELSLACTYRIISDEKSSIIGLPEVKLGILPGFGGTQRLPRLVGLPKALDIILSGKTLRPRQALNVGLVNEVLQSSRLLERADSIASGAAIPKEIKLKISEKILTYTNIGRGFVKKQAQKTVQKETKGFYPAPPAALESVMVGLELGKAKGYAHEAKELGRLIVSPESKALVNVFFLSEGSKGLGKSARKDVETINSVVIGAGIMGAGIAGALARSGCSVVMKDTSEAALAKGKDHIVQNLQKMKYLSETEKSFILNRIETNSRELHNAASINFVIEAIFENLDVKKKVLSDIAQSVSPDAVIATNTSSLSVSKIAEGIENPERVVGMHFFNPVEKMPLVEIVMGAKTSNKTLAVIAALTAKLGKYPIIVRDVPGFLINRILSPYLNEAAFLLQEGYSIADIDTAALKFGMPMGPVRLLDEVGLDVASHVSDIMVAGYGDRMKAPAFTKVLAAAGRMGRKSGGGFYDFSGESPVPFKDTREVLKLPSTEKSISNHAPITERLLMALINEAVKCFDEGVAGDPGTDAANQINLGTVMGMGFPPFRGGVLYYIDSIGSKAVFDSLSKFEKEYGARFTPAQGIVERAKSGKPFCG